LDSAKAIARIQAVSSVIQGCTLASLQRTNHLDWRKMGDKFYMEASGAQKIRPIWGIYYRNRQVTREPYPDGNYAYLVTGKVGSKVLDQLYGEVVIEVDGGRSSNDPFFKGKDGNKEVDPLDVRKASLTNWEARAVTSLLGLKNVSAEDLKKNGVNVEAVQSVEYQKGAEGGGQTQLISDAQRKRMYAIQKSGGVTDDASKSLLSAFGFDSSTKVTRERYEEICTTLEAGPAKVAQKIVSMVRQQTQGMP
jgi:hypothetical protein